MTTSSLRIILTSALLGLSATAWANSSAACSRSLRADKVALESFKPSNLTCHQYGSNAGALHCPPGRCRELTPDSDAPDNLPPEITSHSISLGGGAPLLRLDCNGFGAPACTLNRTKSNQGNSLSFNAELTIAPGDGCLYTSQRESADHPILRKYCWQSNSVRERTQPFSYVGLKSSTTTILRLRKEPSDSADVVQVIKPSQFVEVLLSSFPENPEGAWILVRDAFGIVGWVSVKSLEGSNNCLSETTSIKGFCHRGS